VLDNTMLHQGLIELTRVAQDGMRVRASAGGGSFRRQAGLEKCLREAEEGTSQERVWQDGTGFDDRPGVPQVDVVNAGTDGGQMQPMVDQIEHRYGKLPDEYLADGGVISRNDITALERGGITTYLPIMELDQKRAVGSGDLSRTDGGRVAERGLSKPRLLHRVSGLRKNNQPDHQIEARPDKITIQPVRAITSRAHSGSPRRDRGQRRLDILFRLEFRYNVRGDRCFHKGYRHVSGRIAFRCVSCRGGASRRAVDHVSVHRDSGRDGRRVGV